MRMGDSHPPKALRKVFTNDDACLIVALTFFLLGSVLAEILKLSPLIPRESA